MPHKEILEDLREDCDCHNIKYCPLEVLLLTNKGNDRLFEQHKIVEIFKFEQSKLEGKDIGWEESYQRYVKIGMARLFAEIYKSGMKHREIYKKITDRLT